MIRLRGPHVLMLLVFGALIVSACGDNDDGNDGDATAIVTATATAAETEVVPTGLTAVVSDGILTDGAGMTLYVFDNDAPGVSSCTDTCVENWPLLTVDGDPAAGDGVGGTLSTITRDDGAVQVTYNELPLYYYSGDFAAGARNGDGVGGVWHVVEIGG